MEQLIENINTSEFKCNINSPPKVLSLPQNVSYLSTPKTFQH